MQGSSGISGFFCIDKPAGWTSADVVAVLRGALSKAEGYKVKAGHMGTLDPMATGVLVVAVGKATRLFDVLMNKKKGYIAEMTFGSETDTLDSEGNVVNSTDNLPTAAQVSRAISSFIGEIEQIPPKYSAKSVGGVKAYKLERGSKEVEIKPAKVTICSIKICTVNGKKQYSDEDTVRSISFVVDCGGGTYIRSLCRDIAYSCGSLGTMTALRRTYSGTFTLENAVSIEEARAHAKEHLIPVLTALKDVYPIVELQESKIKKFINGLPVECGAADGDLLVTIGGREYAVAHCQGGEMKAKTNLW